MDNITETCLTLKDRLEVIRNLIGEQLEREIRHQLLLDRLPTTLDDEARAICFRASLICYLVTRGTQAPQLMQLRAVLADQTEQDSPVVAGTGSGKTLPMALSASARDNQKPCL